MQGKGTATEPYKVVTYDDFIEYLTIYEFKSGFDKDNDMYFVLQNDINCRQFCLKKKDIVVELPTTDTSLDTFYTKDLNMNNHTISNFFMDETRITTGKIDGPTFRVHNGTMDSWVMRSSNFQSLKFQIPCIQFVECAGSWQFCGICKSSVPSNKTLSASNNGTNIVSITNFVSSGVWDTAGSNNLGVCGNCITFTDCGLRIRYYPNIYYWTANYGRGYQNWITNLFNRMTFDNTKAYIYLSRTPTGGNNMNCHSNNSEHYNISKIGLHIINQSDIEMHIGILHKTAGDGGELFTRFCDSVLKLYVKYQVDVNVYGNVTEPKLVNNDKKYILDICNNNSGACTGNSVVFYDYGQKYNYDNSKSNVFFTNNIDDLYDPEKMIEWGVLCVDNRSTAP